MSNKNKIEKIAILCRGKSLGVLNTLPNDIDLFILVNRFGNELKIDEIGSFLKDKLIYHIMSRTPCEPDEMIRQKYYSKYNIQKVIQPYTTHMKNPHDFSDGNNKYYKFIDDKFYFCGEDNPIPAEWLGDHHIPHMETYQQRYPHHYPSSGNAAIGYTAFDLKPKEIYIVGMDFYDVTYLTDDGIKWPVEDSNRMKQSLTKIIKECEDIKFKVFTCGNYNEDIKNLEVIHFEEI